MRHLGGLGFLDEGLLDEGEGLAAGDLIDLLLLDVRGVELAREEVPLNSRPALLLALVMCTNDW